MPADPEKKALAEKLVREEKARWKAEWLEGQRIKEVRLAHDNPSIGPERGLCIRRSHGRSLHI